MPAADFRTCAFDVANVDSSGKDVGRKVYWKLYAVENLIRVVVHSVLTAEINPKWWSVAVNPDIQESVTKFMTRDAKRPWHSRQGRHEIYYTYLSDLSEIMRANSNLFLVHIPDVDQWIARIEQALLPRNIVGHMNWLNATDRMRIDVFYDDFQALIRKLASSGFTFMIP